MDMYVFFCWQYHCAAGICRLPSGSHRAQPVVTLEAVRRQGKDGGCEEHDATWSTPNFGPFAVREKSFTVARVTRQNTSMDQDMDVPISATSSPAAVLFTHSVPGTTSASTSTSTSTTALAVVVTPSAGA